MNDTLDADVLQMELRRVFKHPRERVFDAWTRKEQLMRWMGPSPEISADHVEIDFREGGAYRIGFVESGEAVKWVGGNYLSIRRPERLVFTWTWAPPMPEAGVETTVMIDFSEVEGGTLVHLRHLRFASEDVYQHHAQGWAGTLEKFAAYLDDAVD